MGGEVWVWRDGQRLTPAMAVDWDALNAEFHARTGYWLVITSGVRTDDEQIDIFLRRYVRATEAGNRRVYDYRWWRGVLWARVSPDGTVAPPGESNHQINVAAGRYGALDIRDTGPDAGVLTRGSWRANVFDEIAPKHGYDSEGYAFGESWHKRYNRNPWRAVPSAPTPVPVPEPEPEPDPEEEEMGNFRVIARTTTTNDGPATDWTLVNEDIGLDLAEFVFPYTPEQAATFRRVREEDGKGGVVHVYRGFMSTNIEDVARDWRRLHGLKGPTGDATQGYHARVPRDAYISLQVRASGIATETHGLPRTAG